MFHHFHEIQQPDPSIPLPATPNFSTLVIPDKERAIESITVLKPSSSQVIVYSDGSRIEGKNTAAAAWCANTKHFSSHQLGLASEYGIFEAEFVGLTCALQLAKHSILSTTRQITVVLDNQGVVKDMSHKQTSSSALTLKTTAFNIMKEIEVLAPRIKVALRWCPGHEGVEGNERADQLATSAAKKPLPKNHANKTTFSSFRAAIKEWAKKAAIDSYTPQDIKRLGHHPHPKEHLDALSSLKNKHSISSITQLRTGHIPLFSYLFKRNLRADSTCACNTGPETVEHFLFLCPLHEEPRQDLRRELDELDISFNRTALHHPKALEPIANFTSSSWRLESRWDWAEVQNEATPKGMKPPV